MNAIHDLAFLYDKSKSQEELMHQTLSTCELDSSMAPETKAVLKSLKRQLDDYIKTQTAFKNILIDAYNARCDLIKMLLSGD